MEKIVTNDPKILRAGLTGKWYIVTKWRPLATASTYEGQTPFEAVQKFDVTERINSIIAAAKEGDL